MAKEIYRIKFGKYTNENGVPCCMLYTLGATGLVDGELLTPKKITVKNDEVIVDFEELGIRHEFTRTDDVELFYRDKVTKDASKTEDNAQ